MIGSCNTGGGGLNFHIVGGTTAPSSPSENTIWVETSAAVTGYVFSAAAPSNPAAGTVWFKASASSNVAFSATKKNQIMVYPNLARQYVGGEWIQKTAQIWQNGAWIGWTVYLFQNGNVFSDVTGGWSTSGAWTSDGWSSGSFAVGESALTLSAGTNGNISASPNNPVDLTNYSQLVAVVDSITGTAGQGLTLCVCSTRNENFDPGGTMANLPPSTLASAVISGTGTVSVNIANLTGNAYPKLICMSKSGTRAISVSEVYLQ